MATTVGVSDLTASCIREKASPAPQQPRPVPDARPQYQFIHTVRFWSMVAIVIMHGVYCAAEYGSLSPFEVSLLVQTFKFGTIAFFLISGFLLGDRLPANKPFSYLERRASRLMPAWAAWFVLQVLFTTAMRFAHWPLVLPARSDLPSILWEISVWCFTVTALWFVPNFMVALSCVVLLRRWLNDLRLGAVLLAINLFYTVNVYMRWIPSQHSEALFGFALYVWLGAWCALRKEKVIAWVHALSRGRLTACLLLAATAALIESYLLAEHGNKDYVNTLRLGNQVYGVLITIALVRIRRVTWPRSVDVAAHTYGVYLTHTIALGVLFTLAGHLLRHHGRLSTGGTVMMWLLIAPCAYICSLLLTKALAGRWPWLIGAASPWAPKPPRTVLQSLATMSASTAN